MIPVCDEQSCPSNGLAFERHQPGDVAVHLGVTVPTGFAFRTLSFCSWGCLSQWAYRQAIAHGEEPPPDHPAEQLAAERALAGLGYGQVGFQL